MARACAPTLSTPPGRHRTAPGRATSAVRTSHWCLIIVIVWFSATTQPFLFILFNPSYVSCLSHVVLLILWPVLLILRYCLSGLSCWFSVTGSLSCPDCQLLSLCSVLLTLSYCLFILSCWFSVTVFVLPCWLAVTVSLSCPVDS